MPGHRERAFWLLVKVLAMCFGGGIALLILTFCWQP